MAKNSSWLLLSTAYQVLIAFVKSVVVARSLGVEQYGTYAVIFAFVAAVQEIFNLNFGAAFIKYSAEYQNAQRNDKMMALIKAGYLVSGMAAIVSVVMIVVATAFSYKLFFDIPDLEMLIWVFATGCSLEFFNQLSRAILRVYDKFKINSIVNIVTYTLEFLTICFSLYFFRNNLIALVIGLTLIKLVNFVICNLTAFWEIRNQVSGFWNQSLSVLEEDRKKMTSFLFNNSLSKTLQKLMKKGDVLVLAAFAGPAEVGLYDVARKLAFSLLVIKDPIALAIYPQIAKLIASNNFSKLKIFLRNILVVSTVPYVFGILSVVLLSDMLIELVYGNEFLGASKTLLLLVSVVGIEIILFWTVPYLLSLGKTGYRLRASLVSSAVTIGIALLLAGSFGATGIAFALLVGAIILQAAFLIVIVRHLKSAMDA